MTISIIAAIIMFVLMVVLVLLDKCHASLVFILIPCVTALCIGYSLADIGNFAVNGLKSVASTSTMMIFAIMYFSVLWEVGIFDLLIQRVLKVLGNSVLRICFVTAILSNLTQLDGAGSTTALCTIPPLRPVYEKMNIRKQALLLIFSNVSGIWCLLPWTGGILVACAANNVDVKDVFNLAIPVFIFGIIISYLACIPIAAVEKRHGAGLPDAEWEEFRKSLERPVELKVSKVVAGIDIVMTLFLILGLLLGWLPSTISFIVFYAIAMIINFPSTKAQTAQIKAQAGSVLPILSIVLAVGVLVGITQGTGMVTDLANYLVTVLPASISSHILFLTCLVGVPITCFLGSDNMKTIVMPAIVAIVASFGISAVQVVLALHVMTICAANVTLFSASPYLSLGLADVTMKEHLRYSLLPVWGISLILLAFMLITGVIPF